MHHPPRVYIAGPMSGHPAFNYPAFHAAATRLEAVGYVPVNPAQPHQVDPDNPDAMAPGVTYRDCLTDAITALLTCDALALLPGWAHSRGARIEHGIAVGLDMEIRTIEQWETR